MYIYQKISKKISLAINFFVPILVSAQTITIPNPAPNAGSTLIQILVTLLNNVVMPVAAVLVVMYIVYAGFTFVTAQGNEKKIGEAKQRLLWALIGAGILLGATAISQVVVRTVTCITTGC